MHSLLRTLENVGVPSAAAKAIVVVALFVLASLVARFARFLAARVQRRTANISLDSPLVALARRETTVSLVKTSVEILAFVVAFTLGLVVITGARGVSTLAGASFLAVVIGFAAQRFLMDVIAGIVMFTEGWYTVGSTVVIEPWKLEGVVEEVSVRMTKIRDVSGAVLRVHNSQVLAVRVLPDNAHTYELELFVRDREAGEQLLESVASLVPTGPTAFVRTPKLRAAEELADDLVRLTTDLAVAPGRGWLAEDLLPALIKERTPDDLVVHGPVVLPADEDAVNRFARAEWLLRARRERRPLIRR